MNAIPGACWACGELIGNREKSVTYPGDNLDLAGGRQVHFHMRGICVYHARAYEEQWVAVDPRRERILTYPNCDGILVIHADGSTECASGLDFIGRQHRSQPDCRGHLSHDHRAERVCYVGEDYFRPKSMADPCHRGCDPERHGGTTKAPRPQRRKPATGGLSQ